MLSSGTLLHNMVVGFVRPLLHSGAIGDQKCHVAEEWSLEVVPHCRQPYRLQENRYLLF